VLPWADATYYLGATNLRWLNIWAVNVGSAAVKVTNGYFTNLPACPVPTSNTALDVIKKINAPAVSDGLYGVRHYFQDGDFPDEMKMETEDIQEEISEETGKRISAKLVKTGKKEIEFVRTIGVLVQAVRELTEKVEKLESRT